MADTRQFVLMAAAFLIVAMVIVAMSDDGFTAPPPSREARMVCTFTSYCDGQDCNVPLPGPFQLVTAKGGIPRLDMWRRPEALEAVPGVNGAVDYINLGEGSVLRISLAPSGAMTTRLTRDDASAAQLASGIGACRNEREPA